MENNYDVIVIGGGNGGLASAASFACSGKSVILFEKHTYLEVVELHLQEVVLNLKSLYTNYPIWEQKKNQGN